VALSDTGLVCRYYFDEATSGTSPTAVPDTSGNAYHLDTINYGSGNMAWAGSAGATGLESTATTGTQRALRALVTSDALLTALNGATQVTMELVVRVDAISASTGRVFVINDTAGGNPRLGVAGNSTSNFWFFFNGKYSEIANLGTSKQVLHVVWDTTAGTDDPRIKLYVNGSFTADLGSATGIAQDETLSIASGQNLIAFNRESSGSFDRSFDGVLFYASLYSGAFDSTRVSDHYDVLTADDDEPAGGPVSHALEGAATAGATASAGLTVLSEVMYDTGTEHVRTGTTSPQTFSHAAAASGVRGVVVALVHGTSATDHVSAVSYGGVALTRVVRTTDTVTEPGAAELWFVGTGLSGVQGTQTVSYTPGATTDDIHAVCMTVLSDADLEVIDFDSTNTNAANPSLTLQYGSRTGLAFAALYGGGSAPSAFTPNGNCETVHDHDLGAFYSEVIRQTTPNNADFAIGGTAASDDVAFVAMVVGKVADTNKELAGAATAGAAAGADLTVVRPPEPSYRAISRRNRPGRGPYSIGRMFRSNLANRITVAGGVVQALAGDAVTSAQASAALAVAKLLEGAATAGATASADLAITKVLAGDTTAGALASAGISIGKPLAGDAVVSGLASGELLGGVNLEGSALVGASASGALTLAVPLAGAATAGATASADLAHVVTLAGAAIGSASADGAISVGVNLAGAAIAGASADGQLLLGVTLAGDALASALASAGLTILGSVDLEGAAQASATASGNLSLTVLLTGAATAGATASAGLAGSASLAGDATATGTASAELTLAIPLSGAAIASALASGSLEIVATLAGAALAGGTASADLLKAVSLQGDAVASGTASAALGFREATLLRTVKFASGRPRTLFASDGRRTAARWRESRIAAVN
jgi:hypothetical protein